MASLLLQEAQARLKRISLQKAGNHLQEAFAITARKAALFSQEKRNKPKKF